MEPKEPKILFRFGDPEKIKEFMQTQEEERKQRLREVDWKKASDWQITMNTDYHSEFSIIGLLVKKLGGYVELSIDELNEGWGIEIKSNEKDSALLLTANPRKQANQDLNDL